ncbi:MAG: alpha/beta fold hydrolase [Chitinophagaceae bacterium]
MSKNVIASHNVNILGKGNQPLLFAHGLACDQNVWSYITPAFEDEYKIILFDFIGSGESDLSCYDGEKYASLKGYAADVLAICEALNLKDVIFIGHSVSSMIGLYSAISKPTLFSNLIMIGPSPCYKNEPPYEGGFEKQDIDQLLTVMKEDYTKWVDLFAPMVIGKLNNPDLIDEVKETFCKADPAITYEFAKVALLSDSRNDLQNLKTNTLLMQLEEDLLAPPNVGEHLHKNICNSTLYRMNATGHFPHLSAPEETISMIKQYLDPAKL